jgi:hypothetical protein
MNRIEQIRAECAAEAGEREARLTLAMVLGRASENMAGGGSARIRTARDRLSRLAARDETAETLRVDRAPCFRCGVRSDIGCKHQVAS